MRIKVNGTAGVKLVTDRCYSKRFKAPRPVFTSVTRKRERAAVRNPPGNSALTMNYGKQVISVGPVGRSDLPRGMNEARRGGGGGGKG